MDSESDPQFVPDYYLILSIDLQTKSDHDDTLKLILLLTLPLNLTFNLTLIFTLIIILNMTNTLTLILNVT